MLLDKFITYLWLIKVNLLDIYLAILWNSSSYTFWTQITAVTSSLQMLKINFKILQVYLFCNDVISGNLNPISDKLMFFQKDALEYHFIHIKAKLKT